MVRAESAVIDEIDLDLQVVGCERHAVGGRAPSRRVQRDVPPVIAHRHELEPRLADDLPPQVQGGLGVLPLLQG